MRNESIQMFENRLDILIYAANLGRAFTATEILEAVLDVQRDTVRRCLKDLTHAGYVHRISITHFLATSKTKELFGVTA